MSKANERTMNYPHNPQSHTHDGSEVGAPPIPPFNGNIPTPPVAAIPGSQLGDGWADLGGGLIMQWGETPDIGYGWDTEHIVIFPIPFPTQCFMCCTTFWSDSIVDADNPVSVRYLYPDQAQ